MEGYIYIDIHGRYMVERDASGFATGKVVGWTMNVNEATVFIGRNFSPVGTYAKFGDAAGKCRRLKASRKVVVTVEGWDD